MRRGGLGALLLGRRRPVPRKAFLSRVCPEAKGRARSRRPLEPEQTTGRASSCFPPAQRGIRVLSSPGAVSRHRYLLKYTVTREDIQVTYTGALIYFCSLSPLLFSPLIVVLF